MTAKPVFHLTQSDLADCLREWQRRWQADPGAFYNAVEAFGTPPNEYGESASHTMVMLLIEQGKIPYQKAGHERQG